MSSVLYLEQVGGPSLPVASIALHEPVLIGRGIEARLMLPDAAISRQHAQINVDADGLQLQDLDSRSGTFLNDLRLQAQLPVPLQEFDRIRIGAWRFRVRKKSHLTQRGTGVSSNTSISGLTQIGAPVLAAEARLEMLVEFVAACTDKNSRGELFSVVLEFCRRAISADRAAIFDSESLLAVGYFPDNFRVQALEDAFAASSKGGVVVAELPGKQSAAIAAIRVDSEALGFVQVEFVRSKPLDVHLESLHALVRLAGLAAASIERKTAELRVHRLHQDLETAHRVQKAILPASRGLFSGLNYAVHVHPGRVVAGDLVDIFALDEHHAAFFLGDVSGQGFGAAVQMASAQAYLHAELKETFNPSIAAARCNEYLMRIGGGRFVSAFIAVFDRRDQSLTMVDAGHGHVALLDTNGAVNRLSALDLVGSVPLGVDAQASFIAEKITLSAQHRLLIYSDGVAEHRNAKGVNYSELMERSLQHSRSAEQDIETVLAALKLHGGSMPDDDATFLSVGMVL